MPEHTLLHGTNGLELDEHPARLAFEFYSGKNKQYLQVHRPFGVVVHDPSTIEVVVYKDHGWSEELYSDFIDMGRVAFVRHEEMGED